MTSQDNQEKYPAATNVVTEDRLASRGLAVDFTNIKDRQITGEVNIVNDAAVVSIGVTTNETTLKTQNLRFNQIFIKDRAIRVTMAGVYSNSNGSDTISIKLEMSKNGSTDTTYHTIASTAGAVTNQPWYMQWTMIISAVGTSGTAESFVHATINNVNKDSGSTGTQTLDTTTMQQIKATGTWSAATAGNTLSIRQFIVELI